MVVPIPTEVIPVWFIEKWSKENAESGSALDHYLKTMIKEWHLEQSRGDGMTEKIYPKNGKWKKNGYCSECGSKAPYWE